MMPFIDLQTQQQRLSERLQERIQTVLDHGQYVLGPEVTELESQLADYVETHHCVSVGSGTDALLIALMALDIRPGDEVITTAFSFIASGECIALLGATPVFADIDPKTFNLDFQQIERLITPRTKAILPVSLYGQCADFTAINAIAARHNLPVIEDGAQSFGATYRGSRSCGLTTIGCTSFFPAKPLGGYGEGGACFTNKSDLAERMRQIRNHGQEHRYYHTHLGINGRLDTLQAAVLLAKLEIFPDEVAARGRIGARYSERIEEWCSNIRTPYIAPENTSVYAQYTVIVENRESVQKRLTEQGIPTAIHYPLPLHHQPVFAMSHLHLPQAEAAARGVLSLPMHPYLSEQDQDRVVQALSKAIDS